jgi:hypothetical protein
MKGRWVPSPCLVHDHSAQILVFPINCGKSVVSLDWRVGKKSTKATLKSGLFRIAGYCKEPP